MARSESADDAAHEAIWRACLRDAAGVLAAYITPERYGLDNLSTSVARTGEDLFAAAINERIALGRSQRVCEILESLEDLTFAYRHDEFDSSDFVRGQINIRRLAARRAQGDRRSIPVMRATRAITTPENLLAAEALRISQSIANRWAVRDGAEGRLARELVRRLTRLDCNPPWSQLRSSPRPDLRQLIPIVRGRSVLGVIERDSPFIQLADLLDSQPNNATAFDVAAGSIAFLATRDPDFQDRLFELLCLGWMITAASSTMEEVKVSSIRLQGRSRGPVLTALHEGRLVKIYFQSSAEALGETAWRYRHGPSFRALPDIVLTMQSESASIISIIDAKNRNVASASEVAYKLLGYRENLRLTPFVGIALFPSFAKLETSYLVAREGIVALLRVPLMRGSGILRRLLRLFLQDRPLGISPSGKPLDVAAPN